VPEGGGGKVFVCPSLLLVSPFLVEAMFVRSFIELVQVNRYLMACHGKDLDESELELLSAQMGFLKG
jgi:hypothetical protein